MASQISILLLPIGIILCAIVALKLPRVPADNSSKKSIWPTFLACIAPIWSIAAIIVEAATSHPNYYNNDNMTLITLFPLVIASTIAAAKLQNRAPSPKAVATLIKIGWISILIVVILALFS